MKVLVVAVGRLRPPFQDDVQHYQKLLARHARLELLEVREDEAVERRLPERAFTSLLAVGGKAYDSEAFARFLEDRRQSGRDLCFVIGGPYGLDLPDVDPPRWLVAAAATHPPTAERIGIARAYDPGGGSR